MRVIKRDGREVPYERNRIKSAVLKAMEASKEGGSVDAEFIAECVENEIKVLDKESIGVEVIQDIVERKLMAHGFYSAAKAYCVYRDQRSRAREAKTNLMKSIDEIIHADARKNNQKRENANIDGNTAMGAMLQIGSACSRAYNELYLLRPEHARMHREGDAHIHDADFYALTTTCCQIDILKLFHGGFSTGHGFLREPQSIQSYAALAAIAIQANQNDQHGGQSIPNFDYAMAEGIAKSFRRNFIEKLTDTLDEITQSKENINPFFIKEAIGTAEVLSGEVLRLEGNIKFDEMLASILPNVSQATIGRVRKRAVQATERDTYQAMEGFVHNLNTMHSRAGAQTPFSSINYGTDTSPEGRMAIRNILLALEAGLGHGETCIFPIHIFKVKEGVNYNRNDPNYDLFKLSCRVSAKRLFPNYVFIDSPFNLQYYKPGHPESEVVAMGCRTRVIGNVYDPTKEIAYSRGNLSFTTINLPRLGIESRNHCEDITEREKYFYEKLDAMLEMVAQQLLDRFELQASKHVYNFPFLMGQGIWLDSEKLNYEDNVREVLKHGTLSIGFIGLAETLTALYGQHHGQSEEIQNKGLAIIQHMREFCDWKSQELKMNFSLLATPAEGLAGRFVKMDRERYGSLAGITDRDYYTNSFHIPVWFPITAYEKIKLEAPYHALCNAGHISYVELDGDTAKNVEAFEDIVRWMHDCQMGYGSINHPVDRDPACGYVGVIGDTCPRCGRKDGEAISEEMLNHLKKHYPYLPVFQGIK